ncbi:ion channel-forming bestrophin family protein [Entomortierella parvispora]|uniref:Ion channel-forming bestrophin family protein n=1 Tax=Entomortierella parvispora TaxID=205924 RepID=A0A9P3LRW0_9FUNG|nr:ion channel-forming bestrophin family protein [Entomortierella parvispora]
MVRKYGTTVHVSRRWPLMMRLKGTVIPQIWWQVLLTGVYSGAVFCISEYSGWKMGYTLNLVTVMGMVVSLLLVFRTNTAYDRYWEGRRLWSQMTLCIRNMTRAIWVCVGETETRDLLEKKSAINLLIAFAYSTKHYLREEYGYDYDDMVDLLTHLPKYSLPTSVQPMDWRMDIPPVSLDALSPTSAQFPQQQQQQASSSTGAPGTTYGEGGRARRQSKVEHALAFDYLTPTNIPVELSYYIGSYIKSCGAKGKVDASTLTLMNNNLVSMLDCLTGFERILRTPIPLAYSIHLHHATWIYIFALPFQLVATMGPLVVIATMLTAFTLLGILSAAYEIENPFNDDYNDLPLDDFCKVIQAEVASMVATRAPVPSDWIFSEDNYPLAQSDLSARELSALSLDQIHALMASPSPQDHPGRRSVQLQYSRSVRGNTPSANAYPASASSSALTKINSVNSSREK